MERANWAGSKRRFMKAVVGGSLILRSRRFAEKMVLQRARDFGPSDLLTRTLTPEGYEWLGPNLKSHILGR